MSKVLGLCLGAVLAFAIACSDSANPILPAREEFRYPLTTGTTWTYSRHVVSTFSNTNTLPDSTHFTVKVSVVGKETIFDSVTTIKLREQIKGSTSSATHYHFYEHEGAILYLRASLGTAVVLPKHSSALPSPPSRSFLLLSSWGAHTPKPDSLFRHIPAKVVLHYPLTPDREWKYSEKGKPRRANKRVIGETQVSTPAGTFDVVQVQWHLDFDGDGDFDDFVEFYDYIAAEGLVKRSFLVKNLPLVDDSGTFIGTYNYLDNSELVTLTR